MSKGSRKPARLFITGLSTVALSLSLVLPAFAYGGIELERNCSDGLGIVDSTQCSYNVAQAFGYQRADQEAENENEAETEQELEQEQENEQEAEANVDNEARVDQRSEAEIDVETGDSEAYGHYGVVDMSRLTQVAIAGPIGDQEVESETGDIDVEVEGDVEANGGESEVDQNVESEIKGGAEVEQEAEAEGGDGGDGDEAEGGDGGDIEESGDSGWALAATLAEVESEGGDGEGHEAEGGDAEAEVEGGDARSGNAGPFDTGSGGFAIGGDGGFGGSGESENEAEASGIGDNPSSTATGTASSGPANGGSAEGHWVEGGNTGGNATIASMVGGQATNLLGVNFSQSGNVSSSSGDATNSGSATPSNSATINQTGQPWVNQDQQPKQEGSNDSDTRQEASSRQSAPQDQWVDTGSQRASGESEVEVEVSIAPFFNDHFVR